MVPRSFRVLISVVWLALAATADIVRAADAVPTYGARDDGPSVLLSNADATNAYAGVGRMSGAGTCTAVLLDAGPDVLSTAPAYVLTNGHCVAVTGSNDVVIDRVVPPLRVTLDYFVDTQGRHVALRTRAVRYATMKGQDLAIVELDATVGELQRQGYGGWRPAALAPTLHEPIVIVGAPSLQPSSQAYLRLAACRTAGAADVVLERQWHWFDFVRNDCADVKPGSSGSPVISRRTGELLGLVNTTTLDSETLTDCALDRPCEAVREGAIVRRNTNYMTPLAGLLGCFTSDGVFDRLRPACPLESGLHADAQPAWLGGVNPLLSALPLGRPRRRWDVRIGGTVDFYRVKIGPAGAIDCRDSRGYSAARAVDEAAEIDDPLPIEEGHYFVCLIGGPERRWTQAWQRTADATVVAVEIDRTPPRLPPQLTVSETPTAWRVSWTFAPPEITLYAIKSGRAGETRCADRDGYVLPLIGSAVLQKAARPLTFCAIAYDHAGNATAPAEILLP